MKKEYYEKFQANRKAKSQLRKYQTDADAKYDSALQKVLGIEEVILKSLKYLQENRERYSTLINETFEFDPEMQTIVAGLLDMYQSSREEKSMEFFEKNKEKVISEIQQGEGKRTRNENERKFTNEDRDFMDRFESMEKGVYDQIHKLGQPLERLLTFDIVSDNLPNEQVVRNLGEIISQMKFTGLTNVKLLATSLLPSMPSMPSLPSFLTLPPPAPRQEGLILKPEVTPTEKLGQERRDWLLSKIPAMFRFKKTKTIPTSSSRSTSSSSSSSTSSSSSSSSSQPQPQEYHYHVSVTLSLEFFHKHIEELLKQQRSPEEQQEEEEEEEEEEDVQ